MMPENGSLTIKIRPINEVGSRSHKKKEEMVVQAAGMTISVRLSDQDKQELIDILESA
jgi:hypothetical protein